MMIRRFFTMASLDLRFRNTRSGRTGCYPAWRIGRCSRNIDLNCSNYVRGALAAYTPCRYSSLATMWADVALVEMRAKCLCQSDDLDTGPSFNILFTCAEVIVL